MGQYLEFKTLIYLSRGKNRVIIGKNINNACVGNSTFTDANKPICKSGSGLTIEETMYMIDNWVGQGQSIGYTNRLESLRE